MDKRLEKKIKYREYILEDNMKKIRENQEKLTGKIYTDGKMKGKPLPVPYLERLEWEIKTLLANNKKIMITLKKMKGE